MTTFANILNSFFYISGANFANCVVTYEIARDKLILWIPYVEPRQVLWFGSTPGPDECKARYDVDDVRYTKDIRTYMYQLMTKSAAQTVYLLDKTQAPEVPTMSITGGSFNLDITKLRPAMDMARVIKTDYEVAMIRKANDVSSLAHRKVAEQLLKLTNEREIEAIFSGTCTAAGARDQAYQIIAGAGVNASTLHYGENNKPLKGNQLVVLDAACEWNCYAADITRTLPITGKFTLEAKAIYLIVDSMQRSCIKQIRPGKLFYELHLLAASIANRGLLALGIFHNGTAEEIFAAGTVSAFFPHGLGHHVGLEVHDVSGVERLMAEKLSTQLGRKRDLVSTETLKDWVTESTIANISNTPAPSKGRQALKKNMIVTVEPGM
jgi:Xaa-Pro dipeptidase